MEEFRAPIIDSLVLYLINRHIVDAEQDFDFRDGGCFLNDLGRRKFLQAFVQRMEEPITADDGEQHPRWHVLSQQVKAYKQFCLRSGPLLPPLPDPLTHHSTNPCSSTWLLTIFRRINGAKKYLTCWRGYGRRVQYSVFECLLSAKKNMMNCKNDFNLK